MSFRKGVTCLTAFLCSLTFLIAGLYAQSVTFDARHYAGRSSRVHADLNNDGREDLVYGDVNNGFDVQLSTGDGIYGTATHYSLPGNTLVGGIAIADFNLDGKPDLMIADTTNNLYEYFNNGDGTFSLHATFVLTVPASSVIAGDFNHDGKVDIAFDTFDNSTNQDTLHVWFSNGDGGFTTGPTTTVNVGPGGDWKLGDFDGDGKADLMVQVCDIGCALEVLYGDNAGHFTQVSINNSGQYNIVADVNGDGKSDLIGTVSVYGSNGANIAIPYFYVFYGNSSRTWTETRYSTIGCNAGGYVAVADFNGDGFPDVALVQYADCQGSTPDRVVVLTRKSDGTYNPEQQVYTTSNELSEITALRSDRDTKPDLAMTEVPEGSSNNTVTDLINISTGNFPMCAPPNSFIGINVCSPGTSATSPVQFHVGAAGQTPMRKVEVWVDGTKVSEERYGFSKYSFMDRSVSLANGTHNVSIYAAGWDNWLEHTKFTLTVGSGSSTCSAPSTSGGVHISSPVGGSTVSNPVQVSAKGGSSVTWMEAWIDGTKRDQGAGNSLSFPITLSAGSHSLSVLSKVGSSYTGKQVVQFTVH